MGHEWGSSLAWAFAALYPDRTLQLVAMSDGNPNGYFKGDHANEQKLISWHTTLAVQCLAPISLHITIRPQKILQQPSSPAFLFVVHGPHSIVYRS